MKNIGCYDEGYYYVKEFEMLGGDQTTRPI